MTNPLIRKSIYLNKMKKLLGFALFVAMGFSAHAKKVKFAVDMDTITPNVMGIHIGGDFQTLAGFAGGDWMSNTTSLTQEGTSHIYSVVVDIPAFSHYEYKFINGDQWYDAEFVPLESRVDPMSNDNRWIYVDSLANDTTFVGAIIFAANAPAGLTLMRFFVDMTNDASVSASGVHIAGDFQGWDPIRTRMYSFGSSVYQIIAYGTHLTYDYKFYNGNSNSVIETVPGTCAVGGNRELVLAKDSVLNTVCFGGCSACVLSSVAQIAHEVNMSLYPNPAKDKATLNFTGDENYDVVLTDLSGQTLKRWKLVNQQMQIDSKDLNTGMYFITATGKNSSGTRTLKFIVE